MRYTRSAGTATALLLTAAALACNDAPAPTAPVPDRLPQITNGTPTGSAYGNVGALLIDEDADGVLDGICSGSLIAPTVFLTAGHCTANPPGAVYYVSFAPDVLPQHPKAAALANLGLRNRSLAHP